MMTSSWSPTGNNIYPPCAKSLGIKHEALNLSAGERKRGAFNISRVNNRHSLFKDFLHRFRGVSSKYLGNYLRWFQRYVLLKLPPRSYLVITIMGQSLRFAKLSENERSGLLGLDRADEFRRSACPHDHRRQWQGVCRPRSCGERTRRGILLCQ